MAVSSPLAVRLLAPTMIIKGVDTLVEVDIERDGVAVTLTGSPELTVYDKDGTAIGPYSATLSGTTLSATVLGAATTSLDVSGRYMVKWDFTVDSDRDYSPYNAAALCLTDLLCPVGVTDLTDRHTQMSVLLGGAAEVQKKITQAWGELLSRLYADEAPYWTLRSGSVLRPWLIARTRMLCFADMATAHPSGAIYELSAEKADQLLPDLYREIHARFDTDQDNKITARAVPMRDPRNLP